jgi:hypothetical protein
LREGTKPAASLGKPDQVGEEIASNGQEQGRTNKIGFPGWGKRPATGRSFFAMMVLALLATAFALFLTLHAPAEQGTERPQPSIPRSQASTSRPKT